MPNILDLDFKAEDAFISILQGIVGFDLSGAVHAQIDTTTLTTSFVSVHCDLGIDDAVAMYEQPNYTGTVTVRVCSDMDDGFSRTLHKNRVAAVRDNLIVQDLASIINASQTGFAVQQVRFNNPGTTVIEDRLCVTELQFTLRNLVALDL